MSHIPTADLLTAFKKLCSKLDKKAVFEYGDETGGWYLRRDSGYVICSKHEGDAEGLPFGTKRRSRAEMMDVMKFALEVLELKN